MRLVNDRQTSEDRPDVGALGVVFFALMGSLGIATILLGPLPMIVAHARLEDPWRRIACLLGAVGALLILDVPLAVVAPSFVLGLLVSDYVARNVGFWRVCRVAVSTATVVSVALLSMSARIRGVSLWAAWKALAAGVVSYLQLGLGLPDGPEIELLTRVLVHEGPFLCVGLVLLSVWLSIGVTAHWRLIGDRGPFTAKSLRALRVQPWVAVAFVACFASGLFLSPSGHWVWLARGFSRVLGVLLFIQGCVTLSIAMDRRGVRHGARAVIYILAVGAGFYALVAAGVLGSFLPWQNREDEK